jgi:hypothetical protein
MANRDDLVFNVKLENANSLTDLKKLFKEQQVELSNAKKGTEEYDRALRRLGSVKDEIGDLRDTISALNPEGKVQAFTNVASKLAGGFQAATGAAALFGVQNEELEKTLLRVQAATAFAQGISSIAGLSDSFAVLGTVIKTQVVTAFSTLKSAIIATGIGALAVALGVIIAKTIEYNEAIEEEYDKQKKLNEELKKTTDEYLKQAVASEGLRNTRKGGLNELERELKILEASGAKSEEIAKKKKDILDAEIFNLKVRRSTIEGNAEEEAKLTQLILDKENEKLVLVVASEKAERDEAIKTSEERKKQSQERVKNMQEFLAKQAELQEEYAVNSAVADQKQREEETARVIQQLKEQADAEAYWREVTATIDEDSRQARKAKARADLDESNALAKQQADAKTKIESQSFAAATAVSNLYFQSQLNQAKGNAKEEQKIRKQQFEVDKAFSVARAVIDGIRSVQAALTIPPPAGPVLAALNGAVAAANVAAILSTKFEAANTGNTSIPSPSSANTSSAPNISAPAQVSTRLNADGTPVQNQAPVIVEARVVESQMTESQKAAQRTQSQSRF